MIFSDSSLPNQNETKKKKIQIRSAKPGMSWPSSCVTFKKDYFECSYCKNSHFQKKHEYINHFIEKHLKNLHEFEGWIFIYILFQFL